MTAEPDSKERPSLHPFSVTPSMTPNPGLHASWLEKQIVKAPNGDIAFPLTLSTTPIPVEATICKICITIHDLLDLSLFPPTNHPFFNIPSSLDVIVHYLLPPRLYSTAFNFESSRMIQILLENPTFYDVELQDLQVHFNLPHPHADSQAVRLPVATTSSLDDDLSFGGIGRRPSQKNLDKPSPRPLSMGESAGTTTPAVLPFPSLFAATTTPVTPAATSTINNNTSASTTSSSTNNTNNNTSSNNNNHTNIAANNGASKTGATRTPQHLGHFRAGSLMTPPHPAPVEEESSHRSLHRKLSLSTMQATPPTRSELNLPRIVQGTPPTPPTFRSAASVDESSTPQPQGLNDRGIRREPSRTSNTVYYDRCFNLGPIPTGRKTGFEDEPKDGLVLEAFLSKIQTRVIAHSLPVCCSPGTLHGFVVSVNLPGSMDTSHNVAPSETAPIMSVWSAESFSEFFVPSFSDGPGLLADACISLRWSAPQMQFPVICRFRCARAVLVLPQFVVCVNQPHPIVVGQPFQLSFSFLNTMPEPVTVSITLSRPRIVEEHAVADHSSSMLDHAVGRESLAGLECLDRSTHIGLCTPGSPQTTNIQFVAYQQGVYDVSNAVIINDVDNSAVHAKFLGSLVYIT